PGGRRYDPEAAERADRAVAGEAHFHRVVPGRERALVAAEDERLLERPHLARAELEGLRPAREGAGAGGAVDLAAALVAHDHLVALLRAEREGDRGVVAVLEPEAQLERGARGVGEVELELAEVQAGREAGAAGARDRAAPDLGAAE